MVKKAANAKIKPDENAVSFGKNRIDEIRDLLNSGFDVNSICAEGNTPIHLVCLGYSLGTGRHAGNWHANARVIQLLLNKGAKVNAINNAGQTALFLSSFLWTADVVQSLLQKGANPNLTDSSGRSPLMMAAAQSMTDIVLALLKAGANPLARDSNGNSPLHYGSKSKAVVDVLLKANADIHSLNNDGDTVLHFYNSEGPVRPKPAVPMQPPILPEIRAIQTLIKSGCSINALNNAGETPLNRLEKLLAERSKEESITGSEESLKQKIYQAMLESDKSRTIATNDSDTASRLTLSDHKARSRLRPTRMEEINSDIKDKIKLAKNPETSLKVLTPLVGRVPLVDRLLARHPKATAEMLEKLSRSSDKTVCRNVASHPSTSRNLLIKLAREYPKSFFKNPATPDILSAGPSIPNSFDRKKLIKMLQSRDCPDALAQWAFQHGDIWHQAAYVCHRDRSPPIMAMFRESQYPSIVAAVLQYDDASYIQWGRDLGYSLPTDLNEEDGAPTRYEVGDWETVMMGKISNDVPESWNGTFQGKFLRAAGSLLGGYFGNGFMNWEEDGYNDLLKFVYHTLVNEESFSPLVIKVIEADVKTIQGSGDTGESVAKEKQPYEVLVVPLGTDSDTSIWRLSAVAWVWCERNKKLIPYQET